ncbi:uncharacterized protein LOC143294382 [Babylonia areolata]|uniref:uncharacterized protein LOC143294382 n=1 Tax=Babylonia areolata TaxID=304850 RepID=UPI003FD23B33
MDVCSLLVLHLWGLLLFLGAGEGLNCWHCIAENCDQNPEDNYKAYKTECQPGQQCQKVYFKMKSDVKATEYSSTVRSCAEQCQDQDDFPNCTEWQSITRGCVRRSCCSDDDLCNAAHTLHHQHQHHTLITMWLGLLVMVMASLVAGSACWGS